MSWSNSRSASSKPDYTGQLGFYVALVDDELRDRQRHFPTVGILLCAGRNERVVRYALSGTAASMAIADYTYDTLPDAEQTALPSAAELTAVLETALEDSNTLLDDPVEPSNHAVPSDEARSTSAQKVSRDA